MRLDAGVSSSKTWRFIVGDDVLIEIQMTDSAKIEFRNYSADQSI